MIRTKQDAPFQVEIEFTYGCNMGCKFCGLMGCKDAFTKQRFLNYETLIEIISKLRASDWNSKIVISGHGEPMLNPNAIDYVSIIRSGLPKAHISLITNGTNVTREVVEGLFKAGLNNLAIDEYTNSNNVKNIREFIHDIKGITVEDYIDKVDKNIRDRLMNKSKHHVSILEPIDLSTDKTRKLINRCGSAFPKDNSMAGKRCSKPFREMVFDFEGNLIICCNDFRRELRLPNIRDYATIDELWNCELIEMYRKRLYRGDRSLFPCLGCNAMSYRVGLLPDKMGKQDMPELTERDIELSNSLVKNTDDTKLRNYEVNYE